MPRTDKQSESAPGKHHVSGTEHHPVWLRAALFGGVALAGILAMNAIAALRKDPPVRAEEELVLRASGMVVERTNFQTRLRGYGTVQSRRETDILPQVSGRVVWTHPNLKNGGIIPEGEVLLRIDESDYQIAVEQAEADVLASEAEIEQLRRENESNERRLTISKRMLNVANRDFDRMRALVEDDGVESASALDSAISRVAQEEDKVTNIEMAIRMYPARLSAAEARLKTSQARREQAKLDLGRTEVKAPFKARIVSESVDLGQYVTPASRVLRVADDTILEIPVSVDSTEAAKWLRFSENRPSQGWFSADEDALVRIEWTGVREGIVCTGKIARISEYNRETRTFHLIVEVTEENARDNLSGLTLTAGMFCNIEIEGRVAEGVIVLPREAVDSQGNVLVSDEERMKTVPVKVARYERDLALVSEGLEPGDIVLTTKPGKVIDGVKLDVKLTNRETAEVEG